MKKTIFTGVATALVTPMNPDTTVNYDVLRALVNEQIEAGIDALVICGTTGEKSTLSYKEHVKVIEEAIKTADGRVPIIAGAGSNDTVYSVGLCKEAIALGADALLSVTPYYNKASQAGLIAHYNYIADRIDKPLIVYNVPSRTGVSIQPETYLELSKHENIVAIKEANGDVSSVAKTKQLVGDALDIYSGNDDQIIPIMSLGGKGVISVLSNIVPKETHDMCMAFLNGETEKARDLQLKYIPFINALFSDVNPIPVKEAMNLMGKNVGPVRLPLVPMNEAKKQEMIKIMSNLGLIK